MAEIHNSHIKAEITFRKKSGKVMTCIGRYGYFYQAYKLCADKGYILLQYKAVY